VQDLCRRILDVRTDIQCASSDMPMCRSYRGSVLAPIKNVSNARAAWRPSRMARTTSHRPRRAAPAVSAFSSEV
jgi:hypothetical protein